MPVFSYRCPSCQNAFDQNRSREERSTATCSCGATATQVAAPVHSVLKGDGWFGKNNIVKEQMHARRAVYKSRSDEKLREQPGMKLVPNVGGEEVGSWSEAAKLAKDQKKDVSTYQAMASKEKKC